MKSNQIASMKWNKSEKIENWLLREGEITKWKIEAQKWSFLKPDKKKYLTKKKKDTSQTPKIPALDLS